MITHSDLSGATMNKPRPSNARCKENHRAASIWRAIRRISSGDKAQSDTQLAAMTGLQLVGSSAEMQAPQKGTPGDQAQVQAKCAVVVIG